VFTHVVHTKTCVQGATRARHTFISGSSDTLRDFRDFSRRNALAACITPPQPRELLSPCRRPAAASWTRTALSLTSRQDGHSPPSLGDGSLRTNFG